MVVEAVVEVEAVVVEAEVVVELKLWWQEEAKGA